MRDLVRLIVWVVFDLFRSRASIEAEILTLRQQIMVLRRTAPKKQAFSAIDRLGGPPSVTTFNSDLDELLSHMLTIAGTRLAVVAVLAVAIECPWAAAAFGAVAYWLLAHGG